jgi:hypothetical protein
MDNQVTKTIDEVLEEVVKELNAIKVPVGLFVDVTIPITNSVNKINMCLDAIYRETSQNKKQKEEELVIEDGTDSGAVSSDNS